MIFIDMDGTLIDFYGTAKKFGIELELNVFGKWKWGEPPYPAPEEFYAKAELQPWAAELMFAMKRIGEIPRFITKDYGEIKEIFIEKFIKEKVLIFGEDYKSWKYSPYEAPDKSYYCHNPIDLLIDDCAAECEAWRKKGGIAYHFDLASDNPFGEFIKWWELRK